MTVAGVGFLPALSACLFFCTIAQKPMQPGSLNLTLKCSKMSPGNPFIWGQNVKGQGHKAQKTACVHFGTLVNAGFF